MNQNQVYKLYKRQCSDKKGLVFYLKTKTKHIPGIGLFICLLDPFGVSTDYYYVLFAMSFPHPSSAQLLFHTCNICAYYADNHYHNDDDSDYDDDDDDTGVYMCTCCTIFE